jgi:hypothetical protein
MGQEDQFPRPRLNGRYRFSQGTLAGTRGNGRDAPKAANRAYGTGRRLEVKFKWQMSAEHAAQAN